MASWSCRLTDWDCREEEGTSPGGVIVITHKPPSKKTSTKYVWTWFVGFKPCNKRVAWLPSDIAAFLSCLFSCREQMSSDLFMFYKLFHFLQPENSFNVVTIQLVINAVNDSNTVKFAFLNLFVIMLLLLYFLLSINIEVLYFEKLEIDRKSHWRRRTGPVLSCKRHDCLLREVIVSLSTRQTR